MDKKAKSKRKQHKLLKLVEKSVVVLGQANVLLNHNRRMNVLARFLKNHKSASSILGQNAELLKRNDKDLFGSGFYKSLHKRAKGHKHNKEIQQELAPRSHNSYRGKKPFQRGPSFRNRERGAASDHGQSSRGRGGYPQRGGSRHGYRGKSRSVELSSKTHPKNHISPTCEGKPTNRYKPTNKHPINLVGVGRKCHTQITILNLNQNIQVTSLGGRLPHFKQNWAKISQDPWILQVIRGYNIELVTKPTQLKPMVGPRFSQSEALQVTIEVEAMLEKKAIEISVPQKDQFVGHTFLCLNNNRSFRPVFNLKPFNRFVAYEHFKMEGMNMVTSLLQQGDWVCSIDIKDAYFAVLIVQEHRKYLKFQWQGHLYQFCSLPFGLSSAPKVFTKILKPVVGFLRRIGIRMLIYLDDVLLLNQSRETLSRDRNRNTTLWLLQSLGFMINWQKSMLTGSQTIEYLGVNNN